ncbi:uncharacterized protein LOC8060424 [Sorghum bicolor]|nr:uncharacterized protein LOC8060424 [Sorghum bicolor]|eukprot:XP_002446975.2 uncharacterized protein LOC8060424 [Sorghum bicolor]
MVHRSCKPCQRVVLQMRTMTPSKNCKIEEEPSKSSAHLNIISLTNGNGRTPPVHRTPGARGAGYICTQHKAWTGPAACRLSTSSSDPPAMEAAAGPEKPDHPALDAATEPGCLLRRRSAPWSSWLSASAAGLVAVGLGGAALLVWWALAFHPANARLWMVPAGLVLLGTPVLAWLSLLGSGPCGRQAPPPDAGVYASA